VGSYAVGSYSEGSYDECHCTECHNTEGMLSVITHSAIVLNAIAPDSDHQYKSFKNVLSVKLPIKHQWLFKPLMDEHRLN